MEGILMHLKLNKHFHTYDSDLHYINNFAEICQESAI